MKNNMDNIAHQHGNMLQMQLEFHCSLELIAFTDTPHTLKLQIYRKHSNSSIFCLIG